LIQKGRLRRTTQQSIAALSIGGMVVARTMVDSALLRMNCAPPAQLSLSILVAGTRRANRKTVNPKDSDRSAWPSDSSSRGDANHAGARLTFSPSLLCPDDDRSLSELAPTTTPAHRPRTSSRGSSDRDLSFVSTNPKRRHDVYCPSVGRNPSDCQRKTCTSRLLARNDFRIACDTARIRDLLLPLVS
jgi:hypothetical protein